jgi:8-hydroxy-5-deazaflavin:NADPH oxidoreductase
MRITVIGKGNVGGGLAQRWEGAGHDVTALGREGGDATGAEVVLVAVPDTAIADALTKVRGLGGQVTIDATNIRGSYPAGYQSLAQQVKSIIGGPTAKAFNTNFAALYDQVDAEPVRPGTLFASDPEARATTERLIQDAGFDPVYLGNLGQAGPLESMIGVTMGVARGGLGPFFYRFNGPGGLSRN